VAVVPATVQPAAGALFYLAGGPGGAAVGRAPGQAPHFARVRTHRDLVFVDQRGTGGSHRLACENVDASIDDPAKLAPSVRSCLAGLDGDPRLYTTSIAMDDLDQVRAALGYDRIDLYGASYGATAAQIYLRRHGDHVRSVVLDGASLLDVPVFELLARNGERALQLLLGRCAANARCRRAYPRARAELTTVLARLAKPRRVRTDDGRVTTLDATRAALAIQILTRSLEGSAYVPFVIHQAWAGNLAPLARVYVDGVLAETQGLGRQVMYWSIVCSEPWASFDPARTKAAARGSYLEHAAVTRARLFAGICKLFPRGVVPPDSGKRVRSDAPVLILAGGADPQDPPSGVAGFARTLPHARLVVAPFVGHVALPYGCLAGLTADFVEDGSADGLDTSCAARVPLPPFLLG
jgi:pimeloyl-ACP methyl ester carboxylesterase